MLFVLLLTILLTLPTIISSHPTDTIYGHWDTLPDFDPDNTFEAVSGPMCGNGDMGAVLSGKMKGTFLELTVSIGLNQFWAINGTEGLVPPPYGREMNWPRPVTAGGITLTFPSSLLSPFSFSANQFISNGSIVVTLSLPDHTGYTITIHCDSDSNMLVAVVTGTVKGESHLSITTFTSGAYPIRTGCTGPCNEKMIAGDYVTKVAFDPSPFPVTAALVTSVLGDYSRNAIAKVDATSVTSSLSFSTTPLYIATIIRTNLDIAGIDLVSPLRPTPVSLSIDPLPPTQHLASILNISSLITSAVNTSQYWYHHWNTSCTIVLPDDPLLSRYYYGSQYMIAAAARRGKVAPGLWGPWVVNDGMGWHGDITLNYNAESPIYGTYSSNQLEIAASHYPPLLQYLEQARLNAINMNCTIDACLHFPVHLAVYGYSSSLGPQGDWGQHFIAALAGLNLITHCEYTGDTTICRQAFDMMRGGVSAWYQFWLQKQELSGGGYRYVDPGDCTNESCGEEVPFNGIIALALIRRVLSWLLSMSSTMQVIETDRDRWIDILSHLSDLPTATPSLFPSVIFSYAESNTSNSTPSPGDNPLAVYPIWPAGLISIHSPSDQIALSFSTIFYYIGGWTQGNALPIFFPAAVRVGYPASMVMAGWWFRLVQCMMANLYCSQGGGGVETAGGVMAVNEQLMQSNEWAVNLFPVWPSTHSASFQGMLARGGHLISAEYSAQTGKITNVEISNAEGVQQRERTVRLMHPWQWSQQEKEERAMSILAGQYGKGEGTQRRRTADIPDIEVYRVMKRGELEEETRAYVERFDRPPLSESAVGVGASRYDLDEQVVWFQWDAEVGCDAGADCRWRVREGSAAPPPQIVVA